MSSYGRPVLQAIRSQTFSPTADTTMEVCVRPAFLGQVCTMYFTRHTPKRLLFSISSHCTSVFVRRLHGYYQHVVTKEHSQGPPETLWPQWQLASPHNKHGCHWNSGDAKWPTFVCTDTCMYCHNRWTRAAQNAVAEVLLLSTETVGLLGTGQNAVT